MYPLMPCVNAVHFEHIYVDITHRLVSELVVTLSRQVIHGIFVYFTHLIARSLLCHVVENRSSGSAVPMS
jgi:hypothetical protein